MEQKDLDRVNRFRKAYPNMPFLPAFSDEEVLRSLNFMKKSKQKFDKIVLKHIKRKCRKVKI